MNLIYSKEFILKLVFTWGHAISWHCSKLTVQFDTFNTLRLKTGFCIKLKTMNYLFHSSFVIITTSGSGLKLLKVDNPRFVVVVFNDFKIQSLNLEKRTEKVYETYFWFFWESISWNTNLQRKIFSDGSRY